MLSALSAECRSKRFLKLGEWKLRLSQIAAVDSQGFGGGPLRDIAFESPDGDKLALIHSVFESSMCAYVGMLAVFEDKQRPRLVFGRQPCWVYLNENVWLSNHLLVAIAAAADRALNLSWMPFLLCDLQRRAISVIPVVHAFSYALRKERNKIIIEDKADEYAPRLGKMTFNLRALPWMESEDAQHLPDIARFCCFYVYCTRFGAHRL